MLGAVRDRRMRMEGRGDREGGQGGHWWRVSGPEVEDDEDEDEEQMGQEQRVRGRRWRMTGPGLGGEWDKVEG